MLFGVGIVLVIKMVLILFLKTTMIITLMIIIMTIAMIMIIVLMFCSLSEKTGDLQSSYVLVQKSLGTFPQHTDSRDLLTQLEKHFQHM